MNWMQFALGGSFLLVNVLGYSFTAWIVRKNLSDVKTEIEKIADAHHACRAELTGRFADKGDTRTDIKELFTRTDEQGRTLAQLRGRLNGANA